jgi:hypothetical protein
VYWLHQPYVQENIACVGHTLATVPEHVDGLNFKFTLQHWLLPELIAYMDARMALFGYALPLKVNNEASNWPLGDPELEGQNLFKMVITGLSQGVAQHLWFPWSNDESATPRQGLLGDDGEITKQYEAFQNVSLRIGTELRFASHDTVGQHIARYRFRREHELEPALDALWWDDGTHAPGVGVVTLALPAGTAWVARYDYDGTRTLFPASGSLLATISHEGLFFEYISPATQVGSVAAGIAAGQLVASPNPFAASTTIHFQLEAPPGLAPVPPDHLEIFDAAGRRVRLLETTWVGADLLAGTWDGRDDRGRRLAAGCYWFRIETAFGTVTTRVQRVQ